MVNLIVVPRHVKPLNQRRQFEVITPVYLTLTKIVHLQGMCIDQLKG